MKNIIVAYDKNRAIGKNNKLPWQGQLPADLDYFKKITTGHPIIMGRKTFESIGRPLPGRKNIVISRTMMSDGDIEVFTDLDQACGFANSKQDCFIIGGGSIFSEVIKSADKIYATEINAVFGGTDVFFPVLGNTKWREVSREKHLADKSNKYNYDFVIYERI